MDTPNHPRQEGCWDYCLHAPWGARAIVHAAGHARRRSPNRDRHQSPSSPYADAVCALRRFGVRVGAAAALRPRWHPCRPAWKASCRSQLPC
eukprot:8985253-Pyramimonas_sp.AAC.1